MSTNGYRPVDLAALRRAFCEAGITEAAHAKALARIAMEARPGHVVSGRECERVRKLVDSWFGHKGDRLHLQGKSIDTLELLVGRTAAGALVGRPRESRQPDLSGAVECVERLLAPFRDAPWTFFDDAHQDARAAVEGALTRFARPYRHESIAALKRTLDAYDHGGVCLALALAPFVRQWPYERSPRETDVGLLCAIARVGNDLCQFVDRRGLPAAAIPHHRLARGLLGSLVGLLHTVAHDPGVSEAARASATYQLSRHHSISVQIMGDSPFNLARCSERVPLHDEGRFVAEMRRAMHYADRLSGFDRVPGLSSVDRAELRPTLTAILQRGLCYARDPKRRPTRPAVDAALDRLLSPHAFAKRYSTRLRFHVANGERAAARSLCDDLRRHLADAGDGAMAGLLAPVMTVNSHRCGGDASTREYARAIEALRAEPAALLIHGHHLLSTGPEDELLSLL